MRRTFNWYCIIPAGFIVFSFLLSAGTGLAAEQERNLAWLSLLLGNSQIARSVVKDGVTMVEKAAAGDIVQASIDSADNTLLKVSSSWSVSAQAGTALLLLPDTDSRFPLGLAGRVVDVMDNGDGTKSLKLEKVTYADIFEIATFDLHDIVLDASNFVGVIAPSAVQAASPQATAKSAMFKGHSPAGNVFSFRNGAVVIGPSAGTTSALAKDKTDTTIDAGTVSLNIKIDLADMGDGVEANTMQPVDADTSLGFVIKGSLDNIKLTDKHDFSKTDGLKSLDLRVDADFNFDIKFNGKGSVKFGYFSQAWKEVAAEQVKLLGVSAKLTGLSSDDKIGKFPITGLVWSIPCPQTCPVITGSTQTPLRQAKTLGVIVWVYATLDGELSVEGDLGLARLSPAALSLGLKKPEGGDLEVVRSLKRHPGSARLLEAPYLNGSLGAKVFAGMTVDLDFFAGGLRLANAEVDLGTEFRMDLTGDISYGTDSLSSPWSWQGNACFTSSIGAGAVFRAAAGFGVKLDTSWKKISSDYRYAIQWPTEEEMGLSGLHGTWYAEQGENRCVGTGGAVPECGTAFLDLCATETDCTNAGGSWYNNTCNSTAPPAITPVPLNDTGLTWSGNYKSGNNATCVASTSPDGDNVVTAQDCSHGRDVTHNDDSDGHAGFSFTKLDSNGIPLADQSADFATTPWACVKDNVTGLIWEVKTDDNGLHDQHDAYNWYNTDPATNGGADGYADDDGNICYGYDSGDASTFCNTQAYVARVNAAGWCGASDWRMPTVGELQGIVSYDRRNPAIDTDYFPNTPGPGVWSGSALADHSHYAWLVGFHHGGSWVYSRDDVFGVRLVRGGQ